MSTHKVLVILIWEFYEGWI